MAEELKKKLLVAIEVFSDERIRWFMGKSRDLIDSGVIKEEELDEIIHNLMRDENERHQILYEIGKKGGLTPREIATSTNLSLEKIDMHLRVLRLLDRISIAGERNGESVYVLKPREEGRRACPCEALITCLLKELKLAFRKG